MATAAPAWTEPQEVHLRQLVAEARARDSRNNLLSFVKATFPQYKVSWHLQEIAETLQLVEKGVLKRVMFIEPPRHGKSLLVSERYPAWYLGRNPMSQVIHCSYGGDLVVGFGRRLRNLMQTGAYSDTFPDVQLSSDSKAANLWHTSHGGVYCAAGVGGGITGRGAHLLLIDDPVRGREDADSIVYQARTWDWYLNDAYTRLMPGGAVVIVTTRWHDEDLAGKLIRAQETGGDKWHIVHHPAINEQGEALWPEQYPLKELERIRQTLTIEDTRAWNSLYQGDPTPDQGVYFQREWIRHALPPPNDQMRFYGASDYAVKEGEGDYTVHIVVGIDTIGRMWLVDLWRRQATADKWIPPMIDMMAKWKPIRWAEEKGQIEKAVGPFLLKEQKRRQVFVPRIPFTSSTDKPTRARAIQGQIAYNGLWLPAGAIWANDVESELLKFPAGAHDDIVDCLSLIGRMVAGLEHGTEPIPNGHGDMSLNRLIELESRRMRL